MPELVTSTNPALAFAGMFQDPTNRWFALYVAVSLAIGCIVFYFEARHDPRLEEQGLFRYLFPREIYTHRSALADYRFFLVNKLLFALAFGALVAVSSSSVEVMSFVLRVLAPSPELPVPSSVAIFDHHGRLGVRHGFRPLVCPLAAPQDPDPVGVPQSASFGRGAHAGDGRARASSR